jgi:ABC-type amino acid transport substrate-binding protein
MIKTLLCRTGLLLLLSLCGHGIARAEANETAYERVLRTGVIRCAYMIWPAFFERNAQTNQFSGYNYDIMEAVAKSLNIKVEWATETFAGTQVDTLKARKADAICAAEGPLAPSASLYLAYSEPLAYFPFFAYARMDDARFGKDNSRINQADVKIAVIDSDVSDDAARELFPQAQRHGLSHMVGAGQMMLDVVAKKADVIIADDFTMSTYARNNPGKLRKVDNAALFVIPNTFSALRTEQTVLDMLSQGLRNIRDRGVEAKILAKYGIGRDIPLYLPASPYTVPKR